MRFEKFKRKHTNNMPIIKGIILKYIFENKGKEIFQKDIEEEFSIKKSRLSKILSSMEEDELISREPVKEDARLKKIMIGDKAKTLNENVLKSKKEIEDILLKDIDEKDLEIFFNVVDKIVENLKEDIQEGIK